MDTGSDLNIKCQVQVGKQSGTINFKKFSTSASIITIINQQLDLNRNFKHCQLVILPNTTFPGTKLKDDDIPFVVAKTMKLAIQECVFSLYHMPVLIHTSTRKGDQRGLLLDYLAPLDSSTILLSSIFKLEKSQLVYKMNYLSGSRWIHARSSLRENGFEIESGFLYIYEQSSLIKIFATEIKPSFKSDHTSWLYYRKLESKHKKKGYFVLSDFFLAAFKNASQHTPEFIISLDGCTADLNTKASETHIKLENVFNPTVYYLYGQDISDWLDLLITRSANSGNSQVFGRFLNQLLESDGVYGTSYIPRVLREAVTFLDIHLETDGLFRIKGYEGNVNDVKMLYDLGEPVSYDGMSPHVAANILSLWLNELPEPLLTYPLYDEFISTVRDTSTPEHKNVKLVEVLDKLPVENLVCLHYLCAFFNRLACHKHYNPLEAPEATDVQKPSDIFPWITELCQTLILNQTLIDASLKKKDIDPSSSLLTEDVSSTHELPHSPLKSRSTLVVGNPKVDVPTRQRSNTNMSAPRSQHRDYNRLSTPALSPFTSSHSDEVKELKKTVAQMGKTLNQYVKTLNDLTLRLKINEDRLEDEMLQRLALEERVLELESQK